MDIEQNVSFDTDDSPFKLTYNKSHTSSISSDTYSAYNLLSDDDKNECIKIIQQMLDNIASNYGEFIQELIKNRYHIYIEIETSFDSLGTLTRELTISVKFDNGVTPFTIFEGNTEYAGSLNALETMIRDIIESV